MCFRNIDNFKIRAGVELHVHVYSSSKVTYVQTESEKRELFHMIKLFHNKKQAIARRITWKAYTFTIIRLLTTVQHCERERERERECYAFGRIGMSV